MTSSQLTSLTPVSPLTPSTSEHSDVRDVVAFLRRHIVVIVLAALITGAVGFGVSLTQAKTYQADMSLLYSAPIGTQGQDPVRAIDTIVQIAGSNDVLAPVAQHYAETLQELKSQIGVRGDPGADIITIAGTSRLPARASSLANDVAQSLISWRTSQSTKLLQARISSLQQQLDALSGSVAPSAVAAASDLRAQISQARAELAVTAPDLTVITPATVPTSPASPHPARNAAISALVGVLLGILIALFRDRLTHSIRRIEEAEAIYDAPLLGIVPVSKRRNRAELLADFTGSGAEATAFRTIRTNLALLGSAREHGWTIVVSSAVPAEGKSATVANLACAFAAAGKHVLAASADFHDPALHEYFARPLAAAESALLTSRVLRPSASSDGTTLRGGLAEPAGMIEVLSDEVRLEKAVRLVPLRLDGGSVALLSSPRTLSDPAALLGTASMERFLSRARDQYDVIVLDGPPLLASAEAMLLAQYAEAFVLVARLNQLTRNQARRAIQALRAARVAPSGLVVTGDLDPDAFGYGHGYGYGRNPQASRTTPPASVQRM
jgi:succinoglycan biosynthesis transport protein ExoP